MGHDRGSSEKVFQPKGGGGGEFREKIPTHSVGFFAKIGKKFEDPIEGVESRYDKRFDQDYSSLGRKWATVEG